MVLYIMLTLSSTYRYNLLVVQTDAHYLELELVLRLHCIVLLFKQVITVL